MELELEPKLEPEQAVVQASHGEEKETPSPLGRHSPLC